MSKIKVSIHGHEKRSYPTATSASDILQDIAPQLFNEAVAVKVNGLLMDKETVLVEDAEIEAVTASSHDGHDVLLHSASHLMAQAVKQLFPEVKVTIGPTIENRFYYDFDVDKPFSDEDLATIEKRMKEIASEGLSIHRQELSRKEAMALFKKMGESYKVEIIEEISEDDAISAYSQGDFTDLCRGPHVPSTDFIKYFKLLNSAGAYWRGDENNKMLQRIYGTAFATKKQLKQYLNLLEEAKKRDHRKLGKELELFMYNPLSAGSPFFLPKGTIVYNELVNFIRELYHKYEYEEVITPQIFDNELWRKSGHWEHFSEYMYNFELGERDLSLKPMNCPGHTLIYSSDLRSYRDLPLRFADFGRLHRYEKAGVLSGLTRVRSFSQDDAHIFCTPEQIGSEISHLLKMVHEVYEVFDFAESKITLSTRPEKAMGDEKLWDNAETILKETLENSGADFDIDEGEGAFYGPKIDFNVKDALGRLHQLATIQLDFTLPERFDLTYVDEDGKEKRPVMIHRAILGSLERFFGVYLEHCAGEFPLWLAPVQAAVLSVSEKAEDYAEKVGRELKNAGIRFEVDVRADKIGAKIRKSEVSKINVMLVVGEKEAEAGTVSLRRRFLGDLGNIKLADIIIELKDEITNKRRLKKSQK